MCLYPHPPFFQIVTSKFAYLLTAQKVFEKQNGFISLTWVEEGATLYPYERERS
jgi:hypothetical protein